MQQTSIQPSWPSRLNLQYTPTVSRQMGKTSQKRLAQSAGAADYTDSISADGNDLSKEADPVG